MLLFKCRSNKQEYDERQLIIRAEGYKRGFFTMLVMIFILVLINEVGIKVPFDNNFFLFAIIMLSVDVYAIHTIENGAFIHKYIKERKGYEES